MYVLQCLDSVVACLLHCCVQVAGWLLVVGVVDGQVEDVSNLINESHDS